MATAISFSQIPANIRNPLYYAEVSNVAAGYFVENNRVLIIGQSTNDITETPELVPSVDYVKQKFGPGSQLAIMCQSFRNNNSFSELWVLPLNDAAGATKATWSVSVSGPATKSGTINLYIGDTVVYCPVTVGDTQATVVAAMIAKINANVDLPVIASSASAGVVTLTAKNAGTVGNTLTVQLDYLGALAGEKPVEGVAASVTANAGGATDPTLSTKLTVLGDMEIAFYGHPYSTITAINALTPFLESRWNALRGLDGHAFTAIQGSLSALQSLGSDLNDPAQTVVGYETQSPTWAVEVVGSYLGQASNSLSIDPARTLQTLELIGVTPPKEHDQFSLANRSALLNTGIATLKYVRAAVQIERAITTYQVNDYGYNDPSYLDVMTRTCLTYIKKSLGYRVTQKFGRSKLAPDGTIFGSGQAIVTPAIIRAELIAWYQELEVLGICVNPKGFEKDLLVTINSSDPNRVDILLPPTLIANLIVMAVKVEYRLK
jgi:phage tail sheath gpL-like